MDCPDYRVGGLYFFLPVRTVASTSGIQSILKCQRTLFYIPAYVCYRWLCSIVAMGNSRSYYSTRYRHWYFYFHGRKEGAFLAGGAFPVQFFGVSIDTGFRVAPSCPTARSITDDAILDRRRLQFVIIRELNDRANTRHSHYMTMYIEHFVWICISQNDSFS